MQCNLGRARAAHDLAYAKALREAFDILVVGKPNKQKTIQGWIRDTNADVAVFLVNKNLKVAETKKLQGILYLRFEDWGMVCGYVSPNIRIEEYKLYLQRLFDLVSCVTPRTVIIGDFNAKARDWGAAITNERGRLMAEGISGLDLTLINDGVIPTCVTHNGHSFIDLTMVKRGLAGKVRGWRVSTEETLSTHRYIEFQVLTKKNVTKDDKLITWMNGTKFRSSLQERLLELQLRGIGLTPTRCQDIMKGALKDSMAKRGEVMRKIPYWWSDDIESARQECNMWRRRLTRAKARNIEDREIFDRLRETRKILKRLISKSKREKWRELCEELDRDVWGTGYKLVVKELKGLTTAFVITEEKRREILDGLFPVRVDSWRRELIVSDPPYFTEEEVSIAVKGLKKRKAPGPDGTTAEQMEVLWELEPEGVMRMLNDQVRNQVFPAVWKEARVVLIPKTNMQQVDVKAYRPLSLINVTAKLYEALVRTRMEAEVERLNAISQLQYGFRRGRSTGHAIKRVVELRRNTTEKWCLFVAVDVKNAFNSVSWSRIISSLREKGFPTYLRNIISSYLEDRKIKDKSGSRFLSAGVPQGSILGPLLWNLMYDGILGINLPRGVKLTAYADDLAILIRADDVGALNRKGCQVLDKIDRWLVENHLELAPQKTKAVIFKGPRKRAEVKISIRGHFIEIEKSLKYLGVWLDSRGTYGEHVIQTVKKADRRAAALGRLLPNIGGPSGRKREILLSTVHNTILYGSSVWVGVLRIARYRKLLEVCQRKIVLRVIMAYRTVSSPAAQVIAAVPPIELLVEERSLWENLNPEERTEARRNTLKSSLYRKWQEKWHNETERAQRTKELIPDIGPWVNCPHRCIDYFLCQFFTGHGCFRTYLKRIGKELTDYCLYCGDGILDTPDHTVFQCSKWEALRTDARKVVTIWENPRQIVKDMTESKSVWKVVGKMIKDIISIKEKEERAREA